jgi:Formyl transferase
MRIVFIATGEIALPSFRHLLRHGPRPLALVTQPDKPAGRHQALAPPAIKTEALAVGIPVYQPEKIGDSTAELASLQPDILVVMAYGQILRNNILKLPKVAIINLHASLLPKYRGAACIQAAIDAGDSETGITAMHVIRELDAGDVILKRAMTASPISRPMFWRKRCSGSLTAAHPASRRIRHWFPISRNSGVTTDGSIGTSPPPRSNAGSAPTILGPARSPWPQKEAGKSASRSFLHSGSPKTGWLPGRFQAQVKS